MCTLISVVKCSCVCSCTTCSASAGSADFLGTISSLTALFCLSNTLLQSIIVVASLLSSSINCSYS